MHMLAGGLKPVPHFLDRTIVPQTQGGKKNREGEEAGYSQADSNHGNGPAEQQVVVVMNGDGGQEAGPGEAVFPPLRSEDSGLGLSASPSEQHILPGRDWSDPAMGVCPEREDVWRKGGSVESSLHCDSSAH